MLDLSRPHPLEQKLDWAKAGFVSGLSWSADGRRLLGLQIIDGLVPEIRPILWDTETRHVVTPKWLEQWQMAAFSNGTEQFVTLKSDGEIAVWDAASLAATDPEPKLRIALKPGRAGARLSPDGKWIAAIEGDTVALWDAADPGAMPRVLKGHRGSIAEVKFSRDSQWVVTASKDRTARVWPVVNHPGAPAFVELAGGHGAALTSAAFNHDGSQVATSSADNTIRVWDARNGRELATLHWHGDAVNDVEFDAEGRSIISASDDGTVIMGRCEACNATIAQLYERGPEQAVLADDELRQVQAEGRLSMLSALLSKHR
jgi:WD40 repeat protein